jgi:oxygen-independent coproporphyrinogen-3 oxidase
VTRLRDGSSVVAERHEMSWQERAEDALFMGLRLNDGVRLDLVESRFGLRVWSRYGSALQPFVESRLLEYTPPVLRLKREGMLLANEVCSVFV